MAISLSLGLQINEAVCSDVPEPLVALIMKSTLPVKLTLDKVTVFPLKAKATGEPFCVTAMCCLSETFSTVAVIFARQFSNVTVGLDGDVMVTTGAGITGQVPRRSPWASCAGHADSPMVIA